MKQPLGVLMTCPACGYQVDAHSHAHGRVIWPRAGDASICLRCGQVLLFELDFVGLRLRLPTTTELADMQSDRGITELLNAWRATFHREPETRTA